jgi:hypothetical protein
MLSFSSSCLADDKTELESFCAENQIVDVQVVPEGIEPIEIKNLNELKTFISDIKANSSKIAESIESTTKVYNSLDKSKSSTIKTATHTMTWVVGKLILTGQGTVKNGVFTSCREWTRVEGFSLGVDWNERTIYHVLSNGNKRVDFYSKGQLDYYILIDGFIKYYSNPIDLHCYQIAD